MLSIAASNVTSSKVLIVFLKRDIFFFSIRWECPQCQTSSDSDSRYRQEPVQEAVRQRLLLTWNSECFESSLLIGFQQGVPEISLATAVGETLA